MNKISTKKDEMKNAQIAIMDEYHNYQKKSFGMFFFLFLHYNWTKFGNLIKLIITRRKSERAINR